MAKNVKKIEANTVEFAQGGTKVDDSIPLAGLGEALAQLTPDLEGTLVKPAIAKIEGRNEALFLSAGDAIQAMKNIAANNKASMEFMRRAVREMLTIYGMHADPVQRNAQPLTHAVYALNRKDMFGHRGRDLAAKLISWVEGCSAYRWRKDKASGIERFVCKKGEQISTTFTDAQRLVYDVHFDLYSKPVAKQEFDFNKSLARLLEKAERKGVNQEERAKIVALFTTGNAPETVVIKGEEADKLKDKRPALQAKVDTEANTAEAA